MQSIAKISFSHSHRKQSSFPNLWKQNMKVQIIQLIPLLKNYVRKFSNTKDLQFKSLEFTLQMCWNEFPLILSNCGKFSFFLFRFFIHFVLIKLIWGWLHNPLDTNPWINKHMEGKELWRENKSVWISPRKFTPLQNWCQYFVQWHLPLTKYR